LWGNHWILLSIANAALTVNETEYSLFSREAYDAFKANPTVGHVPWSLRAHTKSLNVISVCFRFTDTVGLTFKPFANRSEWGPGERDDAATS
jgi:hypothetical protein